MAFDARQSPPISRNGDYRWCSLFISASFILVLRTTVADYLGLSTLAVRQKDQNIAVSTLLPAGQVFRLSVALYQDNTTMRYGLLPVEIDSIGY